MATRFLAPAANYFSTTLSGAISNSATTITLSSVTNLKSPGYLVIDREDGAGTATPAAREVISFTGISGNDLTGVTRGADGSTARSHSDGALVEATVTVGLWNSLASIVDMGLDNDGYLRAIASPVSISRAELTQMALSSVASVVELQVKTLLSASGASVLGSFGVGGGPAPMGVLGTLTTGTSQTLPNLISEAFTLASVSARVVSASSGASIIVDINKDGTSIFDTATRPHIAEDVNYVSTASIKTKALAAGSYLDLDIDQVGSSFAGYNLIVSFET